MDNGSESSWKDGLEMLADCVETFLQMKSPEGVALAFMLRGAVKYAQAIYDKKHPVTGETSIK